MDLYKLLGIERNVPKSDIRKAYRKMAKKAHPDTGGSPDKFALIKRAHDVLTDDDRRKTYDETGKIDDDPVDNELGNALQWIQMALDHVLQVCQQRNLDPTSVDLLGDCKIFLNSKKSEYKTANGAMDTGLRQSRKLMGKFKAKKGKTNVMESLITARLSILEQQKSRNDGEIAKITKALEIILDHTFDIEDPDAYMSPAVKKMLTMGIYG